VGEISIMITAKALTTIDISLARYPRVALEDLSSTRTLRYRMELSPTPVETITGDPVVQIRAVGIDGATRLSVSFELTVENRNTCRTFVAEYSLGSVRLSPEAPVFTAPLPRSVFVPTGESTRPNWAAPPQASQDASAD
jgi:hypothetical protein